MTEATLSEKSATPDESRPPLRSVHTANFPALLDALGISLLVTTYQAGKLVIVRSDEGKLNTHFRDFPRPMGLAADRTRLAIGTAQEVLQFRNMAAVSRRLDPPGRHDACYLPRHGHVTGEIDVHELAWAGEELWMVNTLFSCLCTLDGVHSFVPRWRPPFVSELAPEDRCHLNGLGMAPDDDGRLVPRYATALASTDTAAGWREHKKDGGVLLEVPSGQVLLDGLSMPHSPRWHNNRLWLLESGKGGLGFVKPEVGRLETVAELPGFTRGLDFHGRFAFIGLSQVREAPSSAVSPSPSAPWPNETAASGWSTP